MYALRHLFVMVLLFAATPLAWPQAVPIRVGLVLPLTGGSSDFGNSARFGAELAVNEINSVGGYLGRPFQLVQRDDRADPAAGRAAALDLVEREHVDFAVGYCNTGVAMNAIDVFQQAKRILMVPCATGTAIAQKYPARGSFIFRVAPPDAMSVKFLIHEIVEQRQLRKVAIFADTTGYGDGGLKDAKDALARLGIEPVFVARFPIGVTSLLEEMRAAKAAGAQAILTYTVGPEHAIAVRDRLAAGVQAAYFAPWTLSFRSVLERAGPRALEGTMMVQSVVHDASIVRRAGFLSAYYAYAKDRPIGSLMAAAQTYDAVHLMLRALFASKGRLDGASLKAALENLDETYHGVVTNYERPFSADDHEAFSMNMIWLATWRQGEIRFVDASDAARSTLVRRKLAAN